MAKLKTNKIEKENAILVGVALFAKHSDGYVVIVAAPYRIELSLNLLAKSAAVILRGIGKITGGGFLEAMAEFITELNDLFGGFRERAKMVEAAMRSPDAIPGR